MAGSVNKAIILGTLGKDPEYRSFKDGGGVTNLSIATSESWKDKKTGERKEKTEWHRVSILNDVLSEIVEKYARKGDRIYVEGMVQTRKWEDKDGIDRYSTEIVVKGFQGVVNLLGRTEKRNAQDRDDSEDQAPRERDRGRQPAGDLDDEIPF